VRVAALEALGRIGDESGSRYRAVGNPGPGACDPRSGVFGLTFENLTNPTDRIPLLRALAEDQALDKATGPRPSRRSPR
jgi:hypothetical protein